LNIVCDGALLTGAAAVIFGVWQIHPPSAWIVGGALAMIGALRVARYVSNTNDYGSSRQQDR
jgi:hypothetical protein